MSLVAILTLGLGAAPAAGAEGVRALERLPLPAVEGALGVAVEPLEPRLVLRAPRGAARIGAALRALQSTICKQVEVRAGEVHLSCRSRRLEAALVPLGRGLALEIRELAGLPVLGEAGFAVAAYPPREIGLSECPGDTPAARGECLLAGADRAGARLAYSEAGGDEARGLAALRLGDLALLAGDARAAEALWRQVALEPWRRLAAVRLCEVTDCPATPASDVIFTAGDVAPALAIDLAVHGARIQAYRGQLAEAATRLRAQPGACAQAPLLCSRTLLSALRGGGLAAQVALPLYLGAPDRERCPLAMELARAAAAQAAELGAPEFAGNLLASVSPLVASGQLSDHLLAAAEFYVAGADLVRAEVLVEYARLHAPGGLKSPRWAAVAAAVRPLRGRRPASEPEAAGGSDPAVQADLAAAHALLERARLLPLEAP